MDMILEGLMKSSKPNAMKKAVVKKLISQSTAKQSAELVVSTLCKCQYFLTEDENPLTRKWCAQVFSAWARDQPVGFNNYFSNARVVELLTTVFSRPRGAIWLVNEGLAILHRAKAHAYADRCVAVSETVRNVVRDNADALVLVDFCQMLVEHKDCVPKESEILRQLSSLLLVKASMFELPADDAYAQNQYFSGIPQSIGGLLQQIWANNAEALMGSLATVFDIVSRPDVGGSLHALGALVQFFPPSVMKLAVSTKAANSTNSDEYLMITLDRLMCLLTWPNIKNVDSWVVDFMHGLALQGRYTLLAEYAVTRICDIFMTMCSNPDSHVAYFHVLSYILLSFQHSPIAFHRIVSMIPNYVNNLSQSPSMAELLKDSADLFQCLMYQHSGFPELYLPILEAIKDCPKMTVSAMRQKLASYAWTASKNGLLQSKTESLMDADDTRSNTGLTGLQNLGNTCYINSIVQMLYMCCSFRSEVLLSSPRPCQFILENLQKVFAFLSFTQRPAYSPDSFVKSCRPSWFTDGAQQDCSEFLRYILNAMHEQEIADHTTSPTKASSSGKKPDSVRVGLRTARAGSDGSGVLSLVEKTFSGLTETCYRCAGCDTYSRKEESFMDLQLAFPDELGSDATVDDGGPSSGDSSTPLNGRADTQGGSSEHETKSSPELQVEGDKTNRVMKLQTLVSLFLKSERLQGDNQYHCDICGGLQNADRSVKITAVPVYLILTLLRFSYNPKIGRHVKILTDVNYPLTLDVPVSLGPDEEMSVMQKYGLVSIVMHSGLSSEHGHYYCYARYGDLLPDESRPMQVDADVDSVDYYRNEWYMFNDSRVTSASYRDFRSITQKFVKDTAYVLVYRLIDDAAAASLDASVDIVTPLHDHLREMVDKDNVTFLEELQHRKKVRLASGNRLKWSSSNWRRDDDDSDNSSSSPPNNCSSGNFNSFLQGPPSVC